jgi:hypothetical protein
MKIFLISKDDWSDGLKRLEASYRLFAPVKEAEFHNFKELAKSELFKYPPFAQIDNLSSVRNDVRLLSG